MSWMWHLNSYAEALLSNLMGFGGGNFGRGLGHEGGGFMNGIRVFLRKHMEEMIWKYSKGLVEWLKWECLPSKHGKTQYHKKGKGIVNINMGNSK